MIDQLHTNIAKASAALSMCILLAAPAGAGPCILPVEGAEPLSDVEAEQPWRLARYPMTLPGHDRLLVRAFNRPPGRSGFNEIDGRTYRETDAPSPGVGEFDNVGFPVHGGQRILLQGRGGIIWLLPKGADKWQRVSGEEPWRSHAYDKGALDLYVQTGANRQTLRWNGEALVPAGPMPVVFSDGTPGVANWGLPSAILTLPEAGGTFAIASGFGLKARSKLFFRAFDGEWVLVADSADLALLADGLRFPLAFSEADVSEDGRLVRLFGAGHNQATLFLRREGDAWTLAKVLPQYDWVTHGPSGIRLAWVGERRQALVKPFLLFWEQHVTPVPPVLHALEPGSLDLRPLPGVAPVQSKNALSVFFFTWITSIPGVEPLLIPTKDGWHAFDGEGLAAIASLRSDRVGDLARIRRVGPLVLVKSSAGVFVLDDDLVAARVDTFPVAEPLSGRVDIEYLEAAGMFVVVARNDTVYVTSDFVRFEAIPSPTEIKSAVAPLPDRAALLLTGSGGLYILEAQCEQDRN